NVIITHEGGSFALLREERGRGRRFRVVTQAVDPISAVGAGDVLLAAFLAARLDGSSFEEALRKAVAAGTASTLELGAGCFEPREAGRLLPGTQVGELEPVAVD